MSTSPPRAYIPSRPKGPDPGALTKARRAMIGGALFFTACVVMIALFRASLGAAADFVARLTVGGLVWFVAGAVGYRKAVVAHRLNVMIAKELRPDAAQGVGPDTPVDADGGTTEQQVFAYKIWHKAVYFLGGIFLLALLAFSLSMFALVEQAWMLLFLGPLALGGIATSMYYSAAGVGLVKYINVAVVLTDEGFEVVRRKSRRTYAWSDRLTLADGLENTYILLDRSGTIVFRFDGDIATFAALRSIMTAKLEAVQDPQCEEPPTAPYQQIG